MLRRLPRLMAPALFYTLFCALVSGLSAPAAAHCQIPCGIFDDDRIFAELDEHLRTITRSLDGIAASDPTTRAGQHDIARWTQNKETHARKIQDLAESYFLAQRVPVVEDGAEGFADYARSTVLLHRIIVAAMRTTQSIELDPVLVLEDRIAAYRAHYIALHGHEH